MTCHRGGERTKQKILWSWEKNKNKTLHGWRGVRQTSCICVNINYLSKTASFCSMRNTTFLFLHPSPSLTSWSTLWWSEGSNFLLPPASLLIWTNSALTTRVCRGSFVLEKMFNDQIWISLRPWAVRSMRHWMSEKMLKDDRRDESVWKWETPQIIFTPPQIVREVIKLSGYVMVLGYLDL